VSPLFASNNLVCCIASKSPFTAARPFWQSLLRVTEDLTVVFAKPYGKLQKIFPRFSIWKKSWRSALPFAFENQGKFAFSVACMHSNDKAKHGVKKEIQRL
jgi:hypothetical protein